jgi:hypothetical protein
MNLLPVFQAMEASGLGQRIRESTWAFAAIESVHLVGLAMIGGAVLLLDLRLLRLVLTSRPLAELARETQPWIAGSLAVMVITGGALFTSEAVKCYYSTPFWVKMWSLAGAVIFTFTIQRRIARADEGRFGMGVQFAVAIVSLALWCGVGAGGRWIGFSG